MSRRFVPPPNSGVAYRCFNCHCFVSGIAGNCRACGYENGFGVHQHPAEECLTGELWNVRAKRERLKREQEKDV